MKIQRVRYGLRLFLALGAIIVIALFLRLHNISSYKFYPDSYQNLLVAHNLRTSGSPVGQLGTDGMLYPDFFGWTRPVYSLAINGIGLAGFSSESAGLIASVGFGVGAIAVAYLLARRLINSRLTALGTALLLAISSSHITWGGFILTETAGVFLLLCVLERILATLGEDSPRHHQEAVVGLLFSLAVLTRYEYIVLLLPIVLLYIWKNQKPARKILSFTAASSFGLTLGWFLMLPMPFSAASLWYQLKPFLILISLGLAFAAAFWLARRYKASIAPRIGINSAVRRAVYSITAVSILAAGILGGVDLSGWGRFAMGDFLICGLALVGLVLMARDTRARDTRSLASFVIIGCTALGGAYYMVNPAMQRYLTHLLPFLLIPAAFALHKIIEYGRHGRGFVRNAGIIFLAGIFILQVATSYRGLHANSGGIWFQPGYEEVSAREIKHLTASQDILLVSFPEPYFYFTGNSTHSLSDTEPFIYLDPSLDTRNLIIVQDVGMRDQFPRFDALLTAEMKDFQIAEYWTGTPYRYQARIEAENRPVRVYKTTPAALRARIK